MYLKKKKIYYYVILKFKITYVGCVFVSCSTSGYSFNNERLYYSLLYSN